MLSGVCGGGGSRSSLRPSVWRSRTIQRCTDLNRQEIAFVFVCVALLAITNAEWSLRRRRLTFFVASVGVEVSHYSTMYFFLGILLAAWAAQLASRLIPRRWRRPAGEADASRAPWGAMARTVGFGSVLVVGGLRSEEH